MATYDYGDLVRCSCTFKNAAGNNADPIDVFFDIIKPGSAKVTHTYGVDAALVKDSTGKYHDDVSCTVAGGVYYYRFYGTGTGQAAGPSAFFVEASEFD